MKLYDKKYVYFDWDDKLEGKKCFIADYIDNLKWNVNNKSNFIQVTKNEDDDSYPFKEKDTDSEWCFAYYDPYYELKLAFKENKILQWKNCYEDDNMWRDWCDNCCPTFENYSYEWRIKPNKKIAECYYINIHKDNMTTMEISEHADNPIFWGTIDQCDYVLKLINKFMLDECLCKCKNIRCNGCDKLLNFVKNIEFKSTRRMTNRELSEYLAKGNGEMKKLGYFINTSIFHCYKNNTENEDVDDNILIRDFGSDEWRKPLIKV